MSNLYDVTNSWGSSSGNQGGKWVIGGRPNQRVINLDVTSSDGGKTLSGTMTYAGEGPIGFEGTLRGSNNYSVKNSWGNSTGNDGGNWVLGYRKNQNVVAIKISSDDVGKTLTGNITYDGEGPVGFNGTQVYGGRYSVENSWGTSEGNYGGTLVFGARKGQNVVAVDVKSSDGGNTLDGTMKYAGEGSIGFTGALVGSNNYVVKNSWGNSSGNPGGLWIIGSRPSQNVIELDVVSDDGGKTFKGTMTYKGEGPIGFRGTLQ